MKEHDSIPLSDYIEYSDDEMLTRSVDFYEEVKRRHTIREFSNKPVSRELIENCIRAAGTAPSGANHQPWFFCAINNVKIKRQIREEAEREEVAFYNEKRAGEEWLQALKPLGTDADKPFLEIAPWLIAIFAQRTGGITGNSKTKNYYVSESVGIATGILIQALHHSGLVTLTHTQTDEVFE
ncbi:nitroreductase family protein [Pleionea litopenaei]|uniref:Nitroreductase family protein n=1 Tax=Pleionea litopenaei TaxID=3070815 RepID=A0AA51RUG8_9GAMM|nr:nitroreductase family protein [Pleionea sp. HL-JVS1]WMS87822.1 nitroreductase family protein [Pleionea sp. HL-JVS1]